jgi:S1-C subfamily serine protease
MENLDVKRWVLILVGLLFSVTAIPVFAQDVTGAGIETMAQAVPYIESIDADGYALASGSGTLVTPTGRIYTNYHVIEGASDFAIYLLQNISELPVLSYYASAEYISPSLDFAVSTN